MRLPPDIPPDEFDRDRSDLLVLKIGAGILAVVVIGTIALRAVLSW